MDDLIETKLAPPALQAGSVERHFALSLLRRALVQRAAWVVAPAGYGKTELLTQWHRACQQDGLRTGWISLDTEDAEIDTFIAYAMVALGRPAGSPPVSAPTTRRAAVARIIAACPDDGPPVVLFLDDVERLGGALDDLLSLLIERLPRQLHLVLASRTAPGVAMTAWRARGQLMELGPEELRMGFSEAQRLLSRSPDAGAPRPLTEGDIALLVQRTEGWPIALRMARDYVRSPAQAAAPLTCFSGRAVELARYLYESMLRELAPDEAEALLRMACVARISGELLNTLTGRRDGGALLTRFERGNLLLSRLDDEGRWYRLHPLLAEFLQQQLDKQHAGLRLQLMKRAALWFEREQGLPEALRLAASCGDDALVAQLLERAGGWRMGFDGRIGLLRTHAAAVPADELLRHPQLALAQALLLLKTGDHTGAAQWLDRIDAARGAAPADGQQACEATLMRVIVSWYLDEVPAGGFVDTLRQLLGRADARRDPLLHGALGNMLAYELASRRELSSALSVCADAMAVLQRAGLVYHATFVRFVQVGVWVDQARLGDALAALPVLRAELDASFGEGGDLAAVADVFLAHALALRGQADEAQAMLDRSLQTVEEQDGWFEVFWAGYSALAGVARLRGDDAGVESALQRGLCLAQARGLWRLRLRLQMLRLAACQRSGQQAAARALAIELQLPAPPVRDGGTDARLTHAAWLASQRQQLVEGRAAAVAAAIEDFAAEAAGKGNPLLAIEANLLAAQAHGAAHQSPAALRALAAALNIAAEDQVLLPFIEAGPALLPLLQELADTKPAASRWLATVAEALRSLRRHPMGPRHPLGLSAREAEIAALLQRGLSNKQIARELDLSERTVKFHVANLFGKLGARSRADVAAAVAAIRPA